MAAERIGIARQHVAEVGIRLVGLQAEQDRTVGVAIEALQRLQQRAVQCCLVAHVVIGGQQHQLRLRILRENVQQREKDADTGSEIARLDDQVAELESFEQGLRLGPPLPMLLGDDRADPVRGDHPLGARDSISRAENVHRAVSNIASAPRCRRAGS